MLISLVSYKKHRFGMKSFRVSTFTVVAFLALLVVAHGQENTIAPPTLPEIKYEILQQPGCPLGITVRGLKILGSPSLTLKLENTSDRLIRAFVLVVEGESQKSVYISIRPGKSIEPGSFVLQGASAGKEKKVFLSLDYVEFADGTSWGADAMQRSGQVAAYFKGRQLAITRLKEMLNADEAAEFLNLLNILFFYTQSERAEAVLRDALKTQTLRGYRHVIEHLRKMRVKTEQARDLARKLELMEGTIY